MGGQRAVWSASETRGRRCPAGPGPVRASDGQTECIMQGIYPCNCAGACTSVPVSSQSFRSGAPRRGVAATGGAAGRAVERMLERYVRFIVRHRVAVVVAVLAVTALFATQLRHLRLEIRRRAQLPQDHPYVQVEDRIINLFGGEKIVVIGLVSSDGDIFTPTILAKVYRITSTILQTPGIIETNVFSLAAPNTKIIQTTPDGALQVRPLMQQAPSDISSAEELRSLIRSDQLLHSTLVSADEAAAIIVAEFDDSLTDVEVSSLIEQTVAPERDESVKIALGGAPLLRAELLRYTGMMALLFPLAVLIIAFAHYEAFRSFQAMLLPLVTALLSVIWALGIVGATRQPVDTWSSITPIVILAVAAGHAVQILKRYYEEYAQCKNGQEAVVRSVVGVAPVMLTAGSIASAGFGSLITFGVPSVRVFGLLLALGVLSALVIEMTFTPACRALLPAPAWREVSRERSASLLDVCLDSLARQVVLHPGIIVVSSFSALAIALIGVSRIIVDNSFRSWFPPTSQIRLDDELLNQKLAGASSLRLLVEGNADGALTKPAVLRAIDDLQAYMETDSHIGAAVSIANHVKRIHQAMHDGEPAYFAIPDDPRLIAQYLFLYGAAGGPDDLSGFLDGAGRAAVIRALSKTDSADFSCRYLERLQAYAAARFANLPASVGIAGGTLGVQTAMNDVVVREKILNLIQVNAMIFTLSAMALRSLTAAFLVLCPLAIAVSVNLGLLGWTGTWLDMSTSAFTAMGVSIGADFALYMIFRIREELNESQNISEAVGCALRTAGKAVFFVSSAVVLGYLALPLSRFSVWSRLGLLTATTILASALASITIVPSVVLLAGRQFLPKRPMGSAAHASDIYAAGRVADGKGRRKVFVASAMTL